MPQTRGYMNTQKYYKIEQTSFIHRYKDWLFLKCAQLIIIGEQLNGEVKLFYYKLTPTYI